MLPPRGDGRRSLELRPYTAPSNWRRLLKPMMPTPHRCNALHHALGITKRRMLVGDCGEIRAYHIQQFSWFQQKIRVRRLAEARIAQRECLIDEDPVCANHRNNVLHDRPPQIVGDDHSIERPDTKLRTERRRGTRFQVHLEKLNALGSGKIRHTRQIAIDTSHDETGRKRHPHVPPTTARHVQNAPPSANAAQKPLHPRRRGSSI